MVDSLAAGNEALKEVNSLLNIEDIERILDETKEASEKQEVGGCCLLATHDMCSTVTVNFIENNKRWCFGLILALNFLFASDS